MTVSIKIVMGSLIMMRMAMGKMQSPMGDLTAMIPMPLLQPILLRLLKMVSIKTVMVLMMLMRMAMVFCPWMTAMMPMLQYILGL